METYELNETEMENQRLQTENTQLRDRVNTLEIALNEAW